MVHRHVFGMIAIFFTKGKRASAGTREKFNKVRLNKNTYPTFTRVTCLFSPSITFYFCE